MRRQQYERFFQNVKIKVYELIKYTQWEEGKTTYSSSELSEWPNHLFILFITQSYVTIHLAVSSDNE